MVWERMPVVIDHLASTHQVTPGMDTVDRCLNAPRLGEDLRVLTVHSALFCYLSCSHTAVRSAKF